MSFLKTMHVLFQTSTPYMNDNFAYVFVHGGYVYSKGMYIRIFRKKHKRNQK